MNSNYTGPNGSQLRRLASAAFNLEDPAQLEKSFNGETEEISEPGDARKIKYDRLQRLGAGIWRPGASEAVAIGAYAFAHEKLS